MLRALSSFPPFVATAVTRAHSAGALVAYGEGEETAQAAPAIRCPLSPAAAVVARATVTLVLPELHRVQDMPIPFRAAVRRRRTLLAHALLSAVARCRLAIADIGRVQRQ